MRKFIKKLQESTKGSNRKINQKELSELLEYMENKGYWIITDKHNVYTTRSGEGHEINFDLTEADAIKIFKSIMPDRITKKTPTELRFKARSF